MRITSGTQKHVFLFRTFAGHLVVRRGSWLRRGGDAILTAAIGGSQLIAAICVTSETQVVSHFVVAAGIGTDGSIHTYDPHPLVGCSRIGESAEEGETASPR
jgi:hypothetical protein